VNKGQREAEGDEPRSEEDVPSARGLTNAIEGLVELADEAKARRRGNMVASMLFHVDVGGDVGAEEGGDNVHLCYLKVVIASECEENTMGSVPNCRSEDGSVVKVMHVATGNQTSFVLEDRS
jgi:hypothetical protein